MNAFSRREVLRCGAVTGLSALAGCQGPFGGDDGTDRSVDRSVVTPPPDGAGEPGWLLVRRPDAYEFLFDVRICGTLDDVTLEPIAENARVLEIAADFDEPAECSTSRVLGSFEVDAEPLTLHVRANGSELATIERSGTTTTALHDLPDLLSRATVED